MYQGHQAGSQCAHRGESLSLSHTHIHSMHTVCTLLYPYQVVVDAVLAVRKSENEPIDLHMVEIMEMMHRTDTDTKYVRSIRYRRCT